MMPFELHYLSSYDLGLLRQFYFGLYVCNFPDRNERESFENMLKTLKRMEGGEYGGNHYHLLVALNKGKIVGGAVCDYFLRSNCGVIEFIVVDPEQREKGCARMMLESIRETLKENAHHEGKNLVGIFGEAEIPFLVDEKVINPWIRLAILGRLGFSKIRFPYVQPPLESFKQPVRHLMLVLRSESSKEDAIESNVLHDFLEDYFKWAMRIEDSKKQLVSLGMMKSLIESEIFRLESLFVYSGMDDDTYYFKEPTDRSDPDIGKALEIYTQSFVHREFTIPTDLFSELIEKKSRGILDYKYHFLILKKKDSHEVVGFSEFFTLCSAGFGGYVAIKGNYRGKNIFRRMIRKVERTMFEDSVASGLRIRGWFGEFEKPEKTSDPFARERLKIMLREGFLPVRLIYDQPTLPGATFTEPVISDKLFLAHKPFGDSLDHGIGIEEFLKFIRDLLRYCYYIDNPETHATFISISKQIGGLSRIPFEESLLKEIS